jgi:hypothetical protein
VGTVVDVNGKTVYFDDQDTTTKILCGTDCAAVWVPVTVSSAPAPMAGITFGTVTRSDGTTQLTAMGHPLYTFVKDGDSGDVYGQDAKDSFAGQSFTPFCRGSPGLWPREESAPKPGGAKRRPSLRCMRSRSRAALWRVPDRGRRWPRRCRSWVLGSVS